MPRTPTSGDDKERFMRLKIQDGGDRPSPAQLEAVDNAIVKSFGGNAAREGLATGTHLNAYYYSYILFLSEVSHHRLTLCKKRLDALEHTNKPELSMSSARDVQPEDIERMEYIGRRPEEALSALSGLKEQVEENLEDDEE